MDTDFDRFHRDELPRLLDSPNAALAAPYVTGLPPIAFRLTDGRVYTYAPAPTPVGITVEPGDKGAATVVELTAADWESFVTERFTRYGLLYNGMVAFPRGSFDDLSRWEVPLRALWHGRPVFDPVAAPLMEVDGTPLDLTQSFTMAATDDELSGFLQAAGYLHVRGVFSADEVARLRDEVERLAGLARPDDSRSWWTHRPDGASVVCQLKYGAVGSELVASLHDDPRILRLIAASGDAQAMRPNLDRNEGTKIIFKNPGASDGLTDLPLHTDCGMGFHPIACPMVLVGVQLDAGMPETGQLHVVAGTHRSSAPDPTVTDTSGWPVVALETRPGDCTVHFGHTLHGAPPPRAGAGEQRGRRTIYPAFASTELFGAIHPFEDLVTAMQRADGTTMNPDERLALGDRAN